MLHFYDKLKLLKRLALAGAVSAVCASPALADAACSVEDGYASHLGAYVSEIEACLLEDTLTRADLADEVLAAVNEVRSEKSVPAISPLASLNAAARAHAIDMAARNYLAHDDLEGRGHTYRIRSIDRQALLGPIGANVHIVDGDLSVGAILQDLNISRSNAANLAERSFNHFGIGIAPYGEKLMIVTLLASVEGQLEAPLPITLTETLPIRSTLADTYRQPVAWTLSDAKTGKSVSRGIAPRLNGAKSMKAPAGLNIVVEHGTNQYVLKGPMVLAR